MELLASASVKDVLTKLAPAIAAGAVNVISVEAIRQQSGERWERKRAQVEEFVTRSLARLSGPSALALGLNTAEFLIVQPEAPRSSALNISVSVLKETLAFFIGAAGPSDVKVFHVSSFDGEALGLEATGAGGVQDAAEGTPFAMRGREAPLLSDLTAGRPRTMTLHTEDGRVIEGRHVTEAVWNVKSAVVTSFIVRSDAMLLRPGAAPVPIRGDVAPSLAGDLALQSLAYADQVLLAASEAGSDFALHVPVSMAAVSHSGSRYRLLHALRDSKARFGSRLLLELTEIPGGAPPSRLAEAVSTLAPFCRAVVGRAPSDRADLRHWRGCGFGGVSVECGHLEPADPGALRRLADFARAAAGVAPGLAGYSLQGRSLILAAWAGGFTHVNGPAVRQGAPDLLAVRMPPEKLYGGAA